MASSMRIDMQSADAGVAVTMNDDACYYKKVAIKAVEVVGGTGQVKQVIKS